MEDRENEMLEYRKSTAELKPGVISLSSMLNKHHFGELYFGVTNDGEVVGIGISEYLIQNIFNEINKNIKPRITPTIEIVEIDNKKIIKVTANGDDTPYSAYGRYYIRSDDEDNEMTSSQLEAYFLNKSYDYSKWENEITPYGSNDIDEELLIEYISKGNECRRINFLYKDATTTLTKLGLLKDGYLNNAGYYLFSNSKPLLLKLAVFASDERIAFTDIKQFRGNIFECIEEGIKYILDNMKWKAEIIHMERVETPEIPLEAIREIVINSFAHMKVNFSSYNEIYITPTKIHIYNPGPMVSGTDPTMFASGNQGSMIRNPLIASCLYYNKTIDAFGTGFERVFKLCKDVKYQYQNNQFGFTFEFLRPQSQLINNNQTRLNESIPNQLDIQPYKLSDMEKVIYDYLNNGGMGDKLEMSKLINKSSATVQRIIKKLMENNLIIRVGSNKTGYWKVK
jgi:ATP-dependent DNA helicase RecG